MALDITRGLRGLDMRILCGTTPPYAPRHRRGLPSKKRSKEVLQLSDKVDMPGLSL